MCKIVLGMNVVGSYLSQMRRLGNSVIVVSPFKGTTSPQAHAGVDEKHFIIVGPTFSNQCCQRVQEAVFICLNRVHLRKVS